MPDPRSQDVTPDDNDRILMSVGGRVAHISLTRFVDNFLGGLLGTFPDKNDKVLMSVGGATIPVSLTEFVTNFLGGLVKTIPDRFDKVLMAIGGAISPVSYDDFIATSWKGGGAGPTVYGFLRIGSAASSQLVRVGSDSSAPRILIPTGA